MPPNLLFNLAWAYWELINAFHLSSLWLSYLPMGCRKLPSRPWPCHTLGSLKNPPVLSKFPSKTSTGVSALSGPERFSAIPLATRAMHFSLHGQSKVLLHRLAKLGCNNQPARPTPLPRHPRNAMWVSCWDHFFKTLFNNHTY